MAGLAIRTHHDDILGVVSPLAFASSKTTVLVIDLDPDGVTMPGTRSLADLVSDGPALVDLVPSRVGVACLPNGGVSPDDAGEVIAALAKGWPDVVLRVRADIEGFPLVHVAPLLPGVVSPGSNTVWVGRVPSEENRTVVRAPTRGAVHAALAGRPMQGRWLRSWARVAEMRWR